MSTDAPTPDQIVRRTLHEQAGVHLATYHSEEDWKAARRNLIATASEIPYIMDQSNFRGLLRHWYIKAGLLEEPESQYQDEREMGHETEGLHARLLQKETGRILADPGDWAIVTNTKYPGIGATLDRLQWCPERGIGIVEMKYLREFMRRYWSDGQIPAATYTQAQVQMLLTGCKWGTVSAMIGGCKPLWLDVEANPKAQADIVRAVIWFARSLRLKEPPEPTGHDTDMQTLDDLHPELDGTVIDVGASMREVWEELREVSATRLEAEKREKFLKCQVRATMGSAVKAIGLGYEFSISEGANGSRRLLLKERNG